MSNELVIFRFCIIFNHLSYYLHESTASFYQFKMAILFRIGWLSISRSIWSTTHICILYSCFHFLPLLSMVISMKRRMIRFKCNFGLKAETTQSIHFLICQCLTNYYYDIYTSSYNLYMGDIFKDFNAFQNCFMVFTPPPIFVWIIFGYR